MDSASVFLRLLKYEQSLSTAHRQIQLRLSGPSSDNSDTDKLLLPQRVVGAESICGGIEYHIDCLASTPGIPLKELIALPAEIRFLTDRGQHRSVCGIVTEAGVGDFDGSLAAYRLVIRDALSVMEQRTNSRIFRNMNELDIVQVLLDEWRHDNVVLASAFEYELDPLLKRGDFPPREQTMQYNETDAAFVRRLLRRRGVSWYVRQGRSHLAAADQVQHGAVHTLVLFNNAAGLAQNAAGVVRYHSEDATDRRDVVTSWNGARKLKPGSVARYSWDYKKPQAAHFMIARVPNEADQGTYGNQLAASLEDYLIAPPHMGCDADDNMRLGHLRMTRHAFESKCFYGEGCVRDFCAGEFFTLADHPDMDNRPAQEREFIITDLQVTARNNLPTDLAERAGRLLARSVRGLDGDLPRRAGGASGASHLGLMRVCFTAVRRGVPIVPDFDPRVDLPRPDLQSAIVVGPPGEEVHCDGLGRVKIRFPGMRVADHEHAQGAGASDTQADSAWVRVSSGWAGNGPGSQLQCGTLSLPRVGTEVLVAFLGGDPDKPIILGQVFNQGGEPPALSVRGGLPGNRHLSGTRSREVGGQRGNQLRFDDTRGEISAQLASDHGATQLNLGWLTHPKANGSGESRGEGAELRSDEAVAIRGAKGVLITAESSPAGTGPQLGRAGLVNLTELIQSVADEMAKLAIRQAGDEDTSRLADLAERLKSWDGGSNVAPREPGGAALLGLTAPAGIAALSPENVLIGSERRIDVASAGNAAVSASGSIFLRAGRGISAFVHTLGIKLVAGHGNVTVQAQDGAINVKSSGRINLISGEAIHIEAPVVRIVSHGAQTEWRDGTITQQSSGAHLLKAATFSIAGPGGATPDPVKFARSTMRADERIVLREEQTDEPVPNQRYTAHLGNGGKIDGVTDDKGRTSLLVGDMPGVVKIELHPD